MSFQSAACRVCGEPRRDDYRPCVTCEDLKRRFPGAHPAHDRMIGWSPDQIAAAYKPRACAGYLAAVAALAVKRKNQAAT